MMQLFYIAENFNIVVVNNILGCAWGNWKMCRNQ